MPMTEENAKKLWCPMAAAYDPDGPVGSQDCVATRCAWWVWYEPVRRRFLPAFNQSAMSEEDAGVTQYGSTPPDTWDFRPAEDDCAGWLEPEEEAAKRRLGACGMIRFPKEPEPV